MPLPDSAPPSRELFEYLPFGLILLDAEGVIVDANPAALSILGASWEALAGQAVAQSQWPTLREDGSPFPVAEYPALLALTTGRPVHGVVMGVPRADTGETRWLLASAVPVLRDGKVRRVHASFEDITERRAVARHLEQTRQQLDRALETAGLGAYEVNFADGKVRVDARYLAHLGYQPGELDMTYAEWWSRIHPDDLPVVKARADSGPAQGFESEYRMRRKDGDYVWLLDRGGVHEVDAQGQMLRVAGVHLDISARMQTEQALRESEARYRSLVDSAPMPIFIGNQSRVLLANPACLKLFGAAREEEFLSRAPMDCIHPDDHPIIRRRLHRAFEEGLPNPAERVRIRRLDGVAVEVEAVSAPFDFQGERAVHVMLLDITERRAREAQLQRLERVERARGGVHKTLAYAADEAGYLREVCRVVREECGHDIVWIGFSRQDAARSVECAAHAGLDESTMARIHVTWGEDALGCGPTGKAIRLGAPQYSQDVDRDPNAEPWRAFAQEQGILAAGAFPLRGEDDLALGALSIYSRQRDPFSPAEVELLTALADDLAQGIRTLRLKAAHGEDQTRLAALREQLQQLLEWQVASQTVAAIAHDLNQPLNAITAFGAAGLRLLRDLPAAPPRLSQAVAGMANQAERAGGVLRQLMTSLRRVDASSETFDLAALAREVLALARGGEHPHARLSLETEFEPMPVRANRLQVERVLLNLLRNGLEAPRSRESAAKVWLRLTLREGMAQVLVEDDGLGIPPETAARLFDPFFTTKPRGLGLGLPISRALVEAQGGRLWHEAEDRGARFGFTLPLAP